jgi:hypothetical protein
MGRLKRLNRNGDKDGCTVSFINDDGEQLTLTHQGPPRESLEVLCDLALSVDESFKVLAYSTPDSILMDLNGSRRHGYEERRSTSQHPELAALAGIGRKEMCHYSLMGGVRG